MRGCGTGGPRLALSFFAQGVAFALLVTRIPAIQDRYGISDGLLPAFLAAVPVLAGVAVSSPSGWCGGSRPGRCSGGSQPVVLLALLGVGAGDELWQVALALGVFGLAVGALDASMNMLGVSLQRAYGRSIMLGFHAAYSLGGIAGRLARVGRARTGICRCLSRICRWWRVLLPAALIGSRWYADGERVGRSRPRARPRAG